MCAPPLPSQGILILKKEKEKNEEDMNLGGGATGELKEGSQGRCDQNSLYITKKISRNE